MNVIKNEKGFTLMALTITIIVMLIITGTLIYNAKNGVQMKKINNLYSDIEQIKSKISEYYVKNNSLPLKGNYCTAEELVTILKENGADKSKSQEDLLDVNDNKVAGEYTYYIIDLSKLDNLTLNYGSDYKTWTGGMTGKEDLYIINITSHQIYYPKGIMVDQKFYYSYNLELEENSAMPDKIESIKDLTLSISYPDSTSGTIYVAKGGKASIKLNVNLELPASVSLSNLYYACNLSKNEKQAKFIKASLDMNEEESSVDKNVYLSSIITDKLEAGIYYIWLKVEDQYGNETITSEIAMPDGYENKIAVEEKEIKLSSTNIDASVEVAIKYDAEILKNLKYGEGTSVEEAKENSKLLPESTSFENADDGDRIYTLVVSQNEYIYVSAEDDYGNITSSYIWAEIGE